MKPKRWMVLGIALAALVMLLAVACGDSAEVGEVDTAFSEVETDGLPDLLSGRPGSTAAYDDGAYGEPTVEEVLEHGLRLVGASPVHIAFRGTGDTSSVRCRWRGVARTAGQREGAIRFWMGLDEDDTIPSRYYVEALFTGMLDVVDAVYRETAKSNFLTIAWS